VPAAPLFVSVEEWDYLNHEVLRSSRSSKVCITCQHFRYEVDQHCVTLLTCPIHQGLIPQGEDVACLEGGEKRGLRGIEQFKSFLDAVLV